jgi:hypothetical protein
MSWIRNTAGLAWLNLRYVVMAYGGKGGGRLGYLTANVHQCPFFPVGKNIGSILILVRKGFIVYARSGLKVYSAV